MTKTECRVLAAVRWETEHAMADALAEYEQFGFNESITGVLLDLSSIKRACDINTLSARRLGEVTIAATLSKLADRGLIEKTTMTGMGGGFTTYKLIP